MENTELLKLPYIMPSQAQKHVTHNEALRLLDAIVQLSIVSADLSTPPTNPEAGARYIVADNATGAWAGHEGKVQGLLDGAWTVLEPNIGWIAYIEDNASFRVWDGVSWRDFPTAKQLNNLEQVGIGTQADTTNRLSVASDASLFSHAGTDHRLVVNKATTNDNASILFQSNWSGRAEFGLSGSDNFEIKVSDDGSNFKTALVANAMDGKIEFPQGAKTSTRMDFSGRWYVYSDLRWIGFSDTYGPNYTNYNRSMGTGSEPIIAHGQLGYFVEKGTILQKFCAAFKSNSAEVTAINVRLIFQYGPWGSAWSNASIARDTLVAEDNLALPQSGFANTNITITEYECPEDGFILMYVKPVGTPSATRFIYSSVNVGLLSV